MKTVKHKVVLFEDDPEFGPKIEKAIRDKLPSNVELVRFESKSKQKGVSEPYEDQLHFELLTRNYSNPILIVSDRDLSRTTNYTGLSEAIVSKVAAELGLPICLYARGTSNEFLERQRSWGDGRVVLDSDEPGKMAAMVRVLVNGFRDIQDHLPKIVKLKGQERPLTPAAVMAHLLGHPELADKIALYGSGDQKMIAEILPFAAKKDAPKLKKRLPSLLGYWLYDSIFRFPGLLVDSVAASSYLNINTDSFQTKKKIRNLFESALYRGPFADENNPFWWRGKLDDIILAAGHKDGRSFAEKALAEAIRFCPCSVNPKIPAGYYCVATKKPVSSENSKGNISWFPPGADLARIRNDVFDEIGPWLGLF